MARERSYKSLGAQVIDLDQAWKDRRDDALALRSAGRNALSIVLGLQALEILLKVRICALLKLRRLPTIFEIHDLDGLLIHAGLQSELRRPKNRSIRKNWERIIRGYIRRQFDLRYGPESLATQSEADEFFNILFDEANGVIPWISSQA